MKPINIEKFKELYSIDEYGTIYSHWKKRYIKAAINSVGYKMARLTHTTGKSRWYMISRLVALTYIGKPDNPKLEINHIDNDKENNYYKNLEWVTHSENILKAFRTTNRQSGQANKGKKRTKITKQRISDAHKKRILLTNILNNEENLFESIGELVKYLKISRRTYNRHKDNYKHYKYSEIPDQLNE